MGSYWHLVSSGQLLTMHRTVPTTKNCPAPQSEQCRAEKPCCCVEHTLSHFSTWAGPQEVDVASVKDVKFPGQASRRAWNLSSVAELWWKGI